MTIPVSGWCRLSAVNDGGQLGGAADVQHHDIRWSCGRRGKRCDSRRVHVRYLHRGLADQVLELAVSWRQKRDSNHRRTLSLITAVTFAQPYRH